MTDDQITDAIAAEIVQRVQTSHPDASPAFRRRLVRLYTLQAAGLASPPGKITDAELGQHLGLDHRRVSEVRNTALTRAYLTYQTRFPELL